MKKLFITISIAFILSIAIHFILYFITDKKLSKNQLQFNTTNKKSISTKKGFTSVKYVKFKKKERSKQKEKIKENITKKIKQTNKKKVLEKQFKISKEVKKIQTPKIKKNIDLKKFFIIDKQEQSDINKNKIEKIKDSYIKKDEELKKVKKLDSLTQSYIKLYGEQYFTFSKEQQNYIKNNISKIGYITQKNLTYPNIAARTNQYGINVVEFLLHPNGDISKLVLIDGTDYTSLDKNSIETIKIAYKDYPTPNETVKIRIYVNYVLY
ncbi:MAG: TonB family protein [Campylobacterota bacterium]|nr:TonB family protein [Campylobacterota bacterium]